MNKILKFEEFVNESKGQRISLRRTNRPFDPNNNQWTVARDQRKGRLERFRQVKLKNDAQQFIMGGELVYIKLKNFNDEAREKTGVEYIIPYFSMGLNLEPDTNLMFLNYNFDEADGRPKGIYIIPEYPSQVIEGIESFSEAAKGIDSAFDEESELNVLTYNGKKIMTNGGAFIPTTLLDKENPNDEVHEMFSICVDFTNEALHGLDKKLESKGFEIHDENEIFVLEDNVDDLLVCINEYTSRY